MLVLVAAAALAPIQTGCYGLTNLCKRLTEVTGMRHTVTQDLSDYPVFVSVKSGDPDRIRNLVAAAMLGEWVNDAGRLRLRSKKQTGDADFQEFKRLFLAAAANDKVSLALPLKDLYDLPPGRILRYGESPTSFINPLPPAFPKSADKPNDFVLVRRVAPGAYEYDMSGHEVNFKGIPSEVKTLLGPDLEKRPITAEQRQSIAKVMNDPSSIRSAWNGMAETDPVASMLELMLQPVGTAVSKDLVIALPDFSIFALLPGATTVQEIFDSFSLCDRWSVVDGAAVATLTRCEVDHPSQTARKALVDFIHDIGSHGVASIADLSQYIANQRAGASDSWTDAMMMVMAGATVDQEFIGDYPFNVRLYTCLTPQDWQLLRARKPFPASAFSGPAQEALLNVLLQSRTRIESKGERDPSLWQTLDFHRVSITPELKEDPALIGFTMVAGEVNTVEQSAIEYERRKKALGHEPLYQPCLRRRLTLTISGSGTQEVTKTGFSETVADLTKPAVWSQLPAGIAKQFKSVLEHPNNGGPAQGVPPPR